MLLREFHITSNFIADITKKNGKKLFFLGMYEVARTEAV